MKYLITGGAGFIGSNIADVLHEKGEEVVIYDNFSTGFRENLKNIEKDIEIIDGDIRDTELLKRSVQGVDYILHQGALSSVPRSIKDPITSAEVNTQGTLNVLTAASEAGVKRVVFASSSSVYGASKTLPKVEDMQINPKSPYAISKTAAELYCRNFYTIYGLETVALRYFNIIGPRQDPNSQYAGVVPIFLKMMKEGKSPTIHGDGEQSRDFTYVGNVVSANLSACIAPDVAGEVFNIGCGEKYTILTLVEYLNEINGLNIEPEFIEPRLGDVKHSLADISKARRLLNYEPKVDFKEGLRRYSESFI